MYLDFHLICPDTEYLVSVLEAAAGCCSVPGSVDCCPAISSQWLWSSAADDPSLHYRFSQSRRMPLLEPSPGRMRLLGLSHLSYY